MYTEGGMSGKRRRENPEGHTEETEKNVTWRRMVMIKQQEIWNAIQ